MAVVKLAMRNEISHATTQNGWFAPDPPVGSSSFLGKSSSMMKKSMLLVKASIDGEYEKEIKDVRRCCDGIG